MIKSIELVRLAIEGNLRNEEYTVIGMNPEVSLENALNDLVCNEYNCDNVHLCVGCVIPRKGITGYLVKKITTIPSAHNLLGAVDAIYEADTDEDEYLYYAVWVIE